MSKHNNIGGFISGLGFAGFAFALLAFGRSSGVDSNGARAAVFFLAVITTTLACAALYVIFGRPTSHGGKARKQQLESGFQLAGGVLLGFALMTTLIGASAVVSGALHPSRLSRAMASAIALVSLATIFSMIQRWAKYFAGWIGYSILNSLLMLSSGHLVNNPSIAVPRWWSLSAIGMALLSAVTCLRFNGRYQLTALDKSALMVWLLAFTFAVNLDPARFSYAGQVATAAMWLGCLALGVAWYVHRRASHRRRHFGATDGPLAERLR